MIIYINDREITEKYTSFKLPEILEEVKNNLDNEILAEIQVNDVEVNEKYLQETLVEKKDIKTLKFITKRSEVLIRETLEEVSVYLPKLKKGMNDTASYFRNGEEKNAHDKFQLIIDGLDWYTDVIINILSLSDEKGLYKKTEDIINELNKPLSDMMVAYNKKDYVLVADILEYEIIEYVNRFISINKRVMLALN